MSCTHCLGHKQTDQSNWPSSTHKDLVSQSDSSSPAGMDSHRQWLNQGPFLKGDIVRKLVAEVRIVFVEPAEVPIIRVWHRRRWLVTDCIGQSCRIHQILGEHQARWQHGHLVLGASPMILLLQLFLKLHAPAPLAFSQQNFQFDHAASSGHLSRRFQLNASSATPHLGLVQG